MKNLIVLRIATEVRHLAGLTLSNNKGTAVLLRYGDVNQSPAGTAAPNDAKAFLKNQEENGGGGGGITLISTVQIPWIALTSTNATAVVLRLRRRGAGT